MFSFTCSNFCLAATPPLAHVNAFLNAIAGVLLVIGYVQIRKGNEEAHRKTMLTAFCVSAVFLACYFTHHYLVGHVEFTGTGGVKYFYIGMLITHMVLAASVVPLALTTILFGFKATGRTKFGKLDAEAVTDEKTLTKYRQRHRRLAKWTFPIWIYVSITGVLVYLMLYQIYTPVIE